ncbi:hypothetical protein A2442_03625 [Candidatus Campbellbacteria bacterium RIFOXYC2_FULL_35_25]|uniref:Uncharacterized protein n=1 Tax=Candidatus Campbellbacteria bacterium RIFOXYC2_FULL_35_25 TaxID=1797582 RepID=A0A1F5EJS0_9BACT|nr:MAG: hypothetical protein A2442_03625 [Candidatus Campbellbacteria bacterium RIFOXYC2_FULL_35_25]
MKKILLIITSIILALVITATFMQVISVIFYSAQLLLKGSELFVTLAFASMIPIGIFFVHVLFKSYKIIFNKLSQLEVFK